LTEGTHTRSIKEKTLCWKTKKGKIKMLIFDVKRLYYRKATVDSIDTCIKLRLDFLQELHGDIEAAVKETIENQLRTYFYTNLPDNNFIGIIGSYDIQPVAAVYLSISERPASLNCLNGRVGTLLNAYTQDEFRNKGVASTLIKKLIQEAKKEQVSMIELAATESRVKLYRDLGFHEDPMRRMSIQFTV
jgi:GNAT superfamily N-acetyltransferase